MMMKTIGNAAALLACALCAVGCSSKSDRLDEYKAQLTNGTANAYYCARRIGECGEPGVTWLLSTSTEPYDKTRENLVSIGLLYASCDVLPELQPMFSSTNARTRAFAARMAPMMQDSRFIPHLQALTNDNACVDDWSWGATVGDVARTSLRSYQESQQDPEKRRKAKEFLDKVTSTQ